MYYYIINPAAGKGAINKLQDKLRASLTSLGIAGEFVKTTGPGDATKLAAGAVAKGTKTIIAVGGDETVNEVINGVTKDSVAVGIIPIGNDNFLAHHLGIHSWQQACIVLAARRVTNFGLIAAGQKYFLSTLTLGFDADLEKQVESAPASGMREQLSRFRKGWGHARQFKTLKASLNIDNQYEAKCEVFSLTIANQKFQNPLADNKLIISIYDQPSRVQLTNFLLHKIRQKPVVADDPSTRFLADRVVLETQPPTGIMIDGKISGRTPIAIRLSDRRIKLITERATDSKLS